MSGADENPRDVAIRRRYVGTTVAIIGAVVLVVPARFVLAWTQGWFTPNSFGSVFTVVLVVAGVWAMLFGVRMALRGFRDAP